MAEIALQRRVGGEQLEDRIPLHQVQRFVCPIGPGHVEIGVDEGEVLAFRRAPANGDVLKVFLVPHILVGAELDLERVAWLGHLESAFTKGELYGVQNNAAGFHVFRERSVMRIPRPESIRIEEGCDDVQRS